MSQSLKKKKPVYKVDGAKPLAWYDKEEHGGYLLVVQFFVAATLMVLLLRITLIPILAASQFLLLFGLIGFFVCYVFRHKIRIPIQDAMMYNTFVTAPWLMVLFLWINSMNAQTYLEKHKVKFADQYADRYDFNLEDDAYEDFWRIRSMRIESRPARSAYIEFTFCDGLLGYKVMKGRELK